MNIYKRGGVWWLKYQADGKVYRRSCKTGNRKEAEKFRDRIDTARKMPTLEDAVEVLKVLFGQDDVRGIALADAFAEYLRVAESVGKANVSSDTMYRRKCIFKNFVAWAAANRPKAKRVKDVTGVIAADYAAELARSGRATKTRKNIIADLSYVWRLLQKAENGIENPWENLSPADTDGKRLDAFTVDQEDRVLAAARKVGKDWLPVCLVARHTGLRYGDVANLLWSEVDLDGGVIRKEPHKTARHGIKVALPMVQAVKDAIADAKRLQAANGTFDADGYCFPLHAALYGSTSPAARKRLAFSEVLKAAGVKGNYTFHSWRHTAATRLAEAGADIETRKRILGHTQDETARRYDHDEHLAELRTALDAAAK